MKKKTVKTVIDILMTASLPVLMAYSLVGEQLHEVAGTAMLVLFLAHHVMNRKAAAAMFKGKQTPERVLNTVVNIILLVVMLALPISGIVMSKHLYTFLPTYGLAAAARTVHLLLSYWGFVLMSFHLGLHADRWLNRRKRKRAAFFVVASVFTIIAAYGIYAFLSHRLADYMFLKSQFVFFDFDKPLALFFADYLAMIILFAWIGYWLKMSLKKLRKRDRVR